MLREGTSWRQFLGVNVEPSEIYNFSMWVRERFCSCPKLRELEWWLLRPNGSDLDFGKERSTHPHGKVSKCFVIAIYVKKIAMEAFRQIAPRAFHFSVGVRKTSVASS